jgi:hypothetical protein
VESSGEVPLVRVEDDPRAESPQSLRFSAFYAIFRADRLIGRGQPPRTVESYDQTAALFVEAAGDPVLADVREQTLEDFARWLQSRTWRGRPISKATQRKHLTQLGPSPVSVLKGIAMGAEPIREMLRRQPFEPFEVVLSNGERYPVRHPEFAVLVRQTLVIGYPDSDRISICGLLHIASIERLPTGQPA